MVRVEAMEGLTFMPISTWAAASCALKKKKAEKQSTAEKRINFMVKAGIKIC